MNQTSTHAAPPPPAKLGFDVVTPSNDGVCAGNEHVRGSRHNAGMTKREAAFSLVELSIVLVILGLLVGGVLAGQSLIRAAELRSVSAEYSRYYAATQSFRDKYFAIPGDFADGTKFWGLRNTVTTNCTSTSGVTASASGQTCDGNGNGTINLGAAVSQTGEMFQFWNQLALAGLIEGSYSGNAGATSNSWDCVVGTNVPKSKLSNGGWSVYGYGSISGNPTTFTADYGNVFFMGSQSSGTFSSGAIFKPEEAWNIDTKLDDGKPGTGKIVTLEAGGATFGTGATSALRCTTSTSNTDYAGTYKLDNSAINCSLLFPKTI